MEATSIRIRNNSQIATFSDALTYHNVSDLGLKGPRFTWKHGHFQATKSERLDWAVANLSWKSLFPKAIHGIYHSCKWRAMAHPSCHFSWHGAGMARG